MPQTENRREARLGCPRVAAIWTEAPIGRRGGHMTETRSGTVPAAGDRRPPGGLEAEVMSALRAAEQPLSPSQVHAAAGAPLAYTTFTSFFFFFNDTATTEIYT